MMGDMEMMNAPRPARPHEIHDFSKPSVSRREIDWTPHADGQWWLMYEGHPKAPPDNHVRSFERLKASSKRWADKHGYVRETRRRERCRLVWIKFERSS
jgi:hypothetical protein